MREAIEMGFSDDQLETLDSLVGDLRYAALMIEAQPPFARQAWLVRLLRDATDLLVQERLF